MTATESLSRREARRLVLVAQGLLGPRWKGGPGAMLRRLRAVQLDTISVLARTHELVAYARLGPLPRKSIEEAYWGGPPFRAFEYWAHAACVVPIEDWPNNAFKRQERQARGRRWHRLENADETCKVVLDRLRSEGPLMIRELGSARKGGPWWDWSEAKIAVEWLLDVGEVVCVRRRGFQRVYDLPERAVPPELLAEEPSRFEQIARLLSRAAPALGVATLADFSVYCGIPKSDVAEVLPALGLQPIKVEGWSDPAWAWPAGLEAGSSGMKSRPCLVSPFDSLAWDRPRLERLFEFRHRLEAYTPKEKRVHGYYSMPVLVGDRLVGRVDPGRDGNVLVARGVHLEDGAPLAPAVVGTARALWSAAAWVGSSDVRIDWVTPGEARPALDSALKSEQP
jgi:uncharacterized protein YcaQ